jgi:hypothetical protein
MAKVSGVEAEFKGVSLGDERRSRRVVEVVRALDVNPALSFPKAMGEDAALEGTYRLLNNPNVTSEELLAPHHRATAQRISALPSVVIAHDTTSLGFNGDGRSGLGPTSRGGQGFFAHVSFALTGDESRLPLGVLASKTWVRTGKKPKMRAEKRSHDPDRESKRWFEQVAVAQSRVPAGCHAVHLMDREGDAYELLSRLVDAKLGFVVRAAHDRHVLGDLPMLSDVLGSLTHEAEREVPLSRRIGSPMPRGRATHPPRHCRSARLVFSASRIEFERPRYALKELVPSISVNVVHVTEIDPPAGEKPVEWILYTSEPVATVADILRVVDMYRARWVIEEFFKALKTGCAMEERQLESFHALDNALALFLPIAWRLLLLRNLSRQPEDIAADIALTPTQLEVLRAVSKRPLSPTPSAKEALLAIAALGGHIKNNGAPGWLVLARGYHDLLMFEVGWLARAGRSDQS